MVRTLNVRRARPEDLEGVIKVERASFDEPYTPSYLEMLMRFGQGTFLVTEAGGDVVGYAVATSRGRIGHVISIAVTQGERRKGVGRCLIEGMMRELREGGASKVILEVKRGNPAINFYTHLGFRRAGILPRYYEDGSDAISMELSLG
jgi:ribosomal-protein-alanine N-acetyltransferase